MKADEFDRRFDAGEDVDAYADWSTARRTDCEAKRVNVALPAWVVAGLDRQARVRGISRQALIRIWIADRLQTPGPG